ncbi:MAG: hypothetical protein COB76_01295 [Alphaproteobacteria bacterium]|nr:MAG: hypothetical protein COB76_01295 [Alphaproteobacteria bacterium]
MNVYLKAIFSKEARAELAHLRAIKKRDREVAEKRAARYASSSGSSGFFGGSSDGGGGFDGGGCGGGFDGGGCMAPSIK